VKYAVLLQDGSFLKSGKHSVIKRSRVTDLNQASLWSAPGHAKNAIRDAVQQKFLKVGEVCSIMSVELRCTSVIDRVRWKSNTKHGIGGTGKIESVP
jgi:hypothetical protein